MRTNGMSGWKYRSPVNRNRLTIVPAEIPVVVLFMDPVIPGIIIRSSSVGPTRVRESGNRQPCNHQYRYKCYA